MIRRAHLARAVFDGQALLPGHAILTEQGRIAAILPAADIPKDFQQVASSDGTLVPGFVDLQVNGGGGVMLNDAPSVPTLATIARAHARLGSTAILPTLITADPDRTAAAISATIAAIAQGVPGIAGLHLEGPHLSARRKGAHDPALIRPISPQDLAQLQAAARALPTLMLTVAPETVPPHQIAALVDAGAVVFLGHSDADFDTCQRAFDAGARGATHLFNAMSQMTARAPGLVGAALHDGRAHAGLIADAVHVHPANMALALAAKQGPGAIFLVTDAMAPAGTDLDGFTLDGRRVHRRDGELRLADGTLAGADIEMTQAVQVLVTRLGLPLATALRMATQGPADAIRRPDLGRLRTGDPARFLRLSETLSLMAVWQGDTDLLAGPAA